MGQVKQEDRERDGRKGADAKGTGETEGGTTSKEQRKRKKKEGTGTVAGTRKDGW